MFNFLKKKLKPSVSPDDKTWIEENILWLIKIFGFERLKANPIITPTYKNFPFKDLNEPTQFEQFFKSLCEKFDLDINLINVDFFDDIRSKQWNSWSPVGEINENLSYIEKLTKNEGKKYNIQIAKSTLNNIQLSVVVISHELAHIKILK